MLRALAAQRGKAPGNAFGHKRKGGMQRFDPLHQ